MIHNLSLEVLMLVLSKLTCELVCLLPHDCSIFEGQNKINFSKNFSHGASACDSGKFRSGR